MKLRLWENRTMGRVTTEVSISNLGDLYEVRSGRMVADQVRRVVVPDALVDTGASTLALTPSLIARLGLIQITTQVRPKRATLG